MPSLKGLALGLGAVIVAGYIATTSGAAKGLTDIAGGVTKAIASPFVGFGEGLTTLSGGISSVLSPTIAPRIAPVFDWSEWNPLGPRDEDRNGNGITPPGDDRFGPGGGGRDEDRNGNGGGAGVRTAIYTPKTTIPKITTAIAKRPEDRPALMARML